MYKIEDLEKYVNNITIEKNDKLPEEFIVLAEKLQMIEEELKNINPAYSIEIKSLINPEKEQYLFFKLQYNNNNIYSNSTQLEYIKYKDVDSFISEQSETANIFYLEDYKIEHKISFLKDPIKFKELIEHEIIHSFLENEKTARKNIANNEQLPKKIKNKA